MVQYDVPEKAPYTEIYQQLYIIQIISCSNKTIIRLHMQIKKLKLKTQIYKI
jgi:hypothetical protein